MVCSYHRSMSKEITGLDLTTALSVSGKKDFILKNPIMVASGTFSNGIELSRELPVQQLGAVVSKGTTVGTRLGNPTPRTMETAAGMLNSIGFQNVGVQSVIRDFAPKWARWDTPVVVNIMGENFQEYLQLAEELEDVAGISALEVNISCPNVEAGGLEFGQDPELAEELIREIRKVSSLPILVKLTPSVADPRPIAYAVEKAGADALTIFNTIPGMAIDVERRKPFLGAKFGGLSVPAIKPVALRHVFLVASETDMPIVASGGIVSGIDVVEFIMAGAVAAQVGTATFVQPNAAWRILNELEKWMVENAQNAISDIHRAALD